MSQYNVATGVPAGVVNRLEVVNIDQQDTERVSEQ
jgi:hypothetical protein